MATYNITSQQLKGTGILNSFEMSGVGSFSNVYSVAFDGVNDSISAGTPIPLGVTTISWWMKTTDSSGNKSITGNGLGRLDFIGTTPFMRLGSQNYRYFANQSSKFDGNWHHWMLFIAGAGQSDITNSRMFVDGSEIATGTTIYHGPAGYSTNNQLIGTGFRSNIAANVDEFAVWTSDKTSDISSIYNGGTPSDLTNTNPVLYYRMGDNDEGTGTTVTDQGSLGRDGTLNSGAAFEEDVPS
tara:strand:- start:1 stop:723 length:723 start_codon:yes stop_codon:yes gene_type:complete